MPQELSPGTRKVMPAGGALPVIPVQRAGSADKSPANRLRATRWRQHRTVWLTRLVDVAVSALALLLLAPIMLVIAMLVRMSSPGPALFRQVRLGRDRKPFVMLKFRSMTDGCSDQAHRAYVTSMLLPGDPPGPAIDGLYKLVADRRVTRLGAFLRKTSLDELPQLINVLRGDMALVGPRPALAWETELYLDRHHRRFDVKPGMTGLWQVSGRSRLTMSQALDLDVEYVTRRSVGFDLWILLRTLPAVLSPGAAR